ncbi:MAG TPA: thiamine phosphate synthase [Pirellulales bacterium]
MDRFQFTPAAGRAIRAAANWTAGDAPEQVSPAALLMGLLDEAETRAAELLAQRGVDAAAVLARWPALAPRHDAPAAALSPEVQNALAEAGYLLADFQRPLELATEHLLLGLIAARDDLAAWLIQHGFDVTTLAAEIRRLDGYCDEVRSPLPVARCEEAESHTDPEQSSTPNHGPLATDHGPLATDHGQLLRLIDAAANRAREGLRVLEDFVRFAWNDRHLTWRFKQLRHDLALALGRIPAADLLASRDTPGDVGTALTTDAERERPDAQSVVTANAKRLQESLRSLEEYGKILSPEMAAEIEQLRYRAYTLERALAATSHGLRRLAQARLYVLIDARPTVDDFERLVGRLVSAGVDVLQLRDKRLTDRELLGRAIRLRELTAGGETLFIMNDRPDLAVLAQADGVHVGQEELSVADCRAIVGPRMLVGVSTHSLAEARQAVLDGANYLGVGPTFASRTKHFDEHALRGPDLLRAAQAEIRLPLFAIGGIDLGNLPRVLATGVSRVAVSGAILSSPEPAQAARDILAKLARQPL